MDGILLPREKKTAFWFKGENTSRYGIYVMMLIRGFIKDGKPGGGVA